MKQLSEKDYFIQACFSDNLSEFYEKWIKEKPDRQQFFNNLFHKYWIPSKYCCESGVLLSIDTIAIRISYWTPFIWKPIHKDLLQKSKQFESHECQLIDTNCNDCKYLNREGSACIKFDKLVKLSPNICQPENSNCFIHRKSTMEKKLNCKQRRKAKLKLEGRIFGYEWYLKNIKNGKNSKLE
jgi:hypothetical protein